MTFTFPGGVSRSWYAGADGIQRWADNDQPVEPPPENELGYTETNPAPIPDAINHEETK